MPPKKVRIRAKRVSRTPRRLKFVAKWDPQRSRYVALDDSGSLLGTSQTRSLAMGIARTGAMKAASERRVHVVVLVETDGKLKEEWTFDPPAHA